MDDVPKLVPRKGNLEREYLGKGLSGHHEHGDDIPYDRKTRDILIKNEGCWVGNEEHKRDGGREHDRSSIMHIDHAS
jgi:hypothetical protein